MFGESVFLGNLAAWKHETSSRPRAVVLLVHGISEHSGRHRPTIEALVARGFHVVRFDLRGAGESGGKRQWIERWSEYVDDMIQVFNWTTTQYPDLPLFAFGHSLGGAVATHFAHEYSGVLAGLVLSAPAYRTGGAIPPLLIAAGLQVAKFLPTLAPPAVSDKSAISRDPEVVRAYLADPLCHHETTLRLGTETLAAMAAMPELMRSIRCPVLIAHGTHDRVILPHGSYELLRELPPGPHVLHLFPQGYHELHNDLDSDQYFAALGDWLGNRTVTADA